MNKQFLKRILTLTFFSIFVCTVFVNAAAAQSQERNQANEEPIWQQLQKISPTALPKFKQATIALDSQNYEESVRLYNEVLTLAPDFEPALRRLGYAYVATGKRKEGQDLTQKALTKNRSVENLVGRASSLLSSSDSEYRPSQPEVSEALTLSKEAWQKSGQTDEQAAGIVAETLLTSDRVVELDAFVVTLKQKFPDTPMTAYYNVFVLANRGDFNEAEDEVKRAEALGIPHEAFTPLLSAINTARDESFFGLGRYFGYFKYLAFLIAAWVIGLFGLFVVGRVLSAKTMRSIEESDPNDVTGGGQASLRKLYKKVISLAGIYYYISQPVIIFLVIAASGAVTLFFLWIGRIPIKLLVILGFVGLATVFYMIKSLVVRVKLDDPGRALTERDAPGLWKLVRHVAATMQTRPVKEIRITHGAELAVYERGSFRAKMTDSSERILIVGVAVLNDFDQSAFRAVLAHEYGHFSNRDTAGGEIAHRVNTDIMRVAESMGQSGTATFYNIGFQFLRLFHFLFRRVTHGATRLQEILADRVAAYHYGAAAFRDGLNHVIRRELEFSHLADKEIDAAFSGNRAIQNLYEMSVQDEAARTGLEKEFESVVSRPTTNDDTHPSPADRYKYIEKIRSKEIEPLQGKVWDLFADRSAITTEMNALVEQIVRATR